MSVLKDLIFASWGDEKVRGAVIQQAECDLAQIREALDWLLHLARGIGRGGTPSYTVSELADACKAAEAALALLPDVAPGMTDLMVPPESIVVTEDTTPTVSVPVERLREIEWIPGDFGEDTRPFCPACMTCRGYSPPHAENCWLAAALRDAGKEEP